jgi:hypothetical protein
MVNSAHFWKYALQAMSGIPKTFSSELSVSQAIPEKWYYFDVNLHYNSQSLPGKLALMIDKNGNLVDSWIGISHLTGVGLQGTFICTNNICDLTAKTEGGLVSYNDHEDLQIFLSGNSSLSGVLTVNQTNKFVLDGRKN